MKLLILAVLLTITQAPTPVPRKAPNQPSGARQGIKGNTDNKENAPKTPIVASPNIPESNKREGQEQGGQNARETIIIREPAPVPHVDGWQKAYVIAACLLVVVGGLGVRYAIKTLREIKRQADEMPGQRAVMNAQLESMRKQATLMEGQIVEVGKQTGVLERSVKAAEASAKAATDNVRMFISKERAQLRIEPKPFSLKPQLGNAYTVNFSIYIYGATEAYIVESGCAAFALPSSHIGDEEVADQIMFRIYALPNVITPNAPHLETFALLFLGENDLVAEIEQGRLFVGLRGFIKYRDVFEAPHETRFRYVWKFSEFPPIGNAERSGSWEPCGPQQDNRET